MRERSYINNTRYGKKKRERKRRRKTLITNRRHSKNMQHRLFTFTLLAYSMYRWATGTMRACRGDSQNGLRLGRNGMRRRRRRRRRGGVYSLSCMVVVVQPLTFASLQCWGRSTRGERGTQVIHDRTKSYDHR